MKAGQLLRLRRSYSLSGSELHHGWACRMRAARIRESHVATEVKPSAPRIILLPLC